jgi:hypothetical protein
VARGRGSRPSGWSSGSLAALTGLATAAVAAALEGAPVPAACAGLLGMHRAELKLDPTRLAKAGAVEERALGHDGRFRHPWPPLAGGDGTCPAKPWEGACVSTRGGRPTALTACPTGLGPHST